MPSRNLVLTGPPAVGKSTVGRLVGELLGREWVDTDRLIEAKLGLSTREIFMTLGEDAFRAAETAVCQELAEPRGLVVSTGGGTIVAAERRRLLELGGELVNLTAPVDVLATRASAHERPLVAAPGALATLIDARSETYASVARQVPTRGRAPSEVARAIVDARAPGVRVLGPTHIGGQLDSLGALLRARMAPTRVVVLTDSNVRPLYAGTALRALRDADFRAEVVEVPAGETSKSLTRYGAVLDEIAQRDLIDRSGLIVALGGGVVGDLAGFVAATYMRGLRLVQVPTSLVAMIDAAHGGKCGIDIGRGKNLAGRFFRPELVAVFPHLLESLPREERINGYGELVKHAVIGLGGDTTLFESLEVSPGGVHEVLGEAIDVKLELVRRDPHDHGPRRLLNLGHTFGHAIEAATEFRVSHGVAVGLGLHAAVAAAQSGGLIDPAPADRIVRLLDAHELPRTLAEIDLAGPVTVHDLLAAMRMDKKRVDGRLRLVLPRAIGDVIVVEDPDSAWVRHGLKTILGGPDS